MSQSTSAGRQKIIKDSGHYVGSTVIGQGFGLFRAILMPIFFSPSQLGIWNLMNLILSYCPHAQLGLTHGMNKAIPLMRGVENKEEEIIIQNSVFWSNLLLSFLAFLGVLLASFFSPDVYVLPFRLLSGIVFIQMLYYYFFSLLRAGSRFILVSNGIFFTSVLTTVFVIGFVLLFKNPILGGLIGLGLAVLSVLFYWIIKGNYKFPFEVNFLSVKKCFVLGIPVLFIGILESFVVSIDRMFIAFTMSEAQLGYYALGIMVSGMISLIPGSFASVLYTTMLERYSVYNDPRDVRSLLIGPMRIIWALISILIAIAVIVLPGIIFLFMPKYIPSIHIIEILLFGSFFMAVSHIPAMFLIAINKQKLIIILQIISIGLVILVDSLAIYFGYGIIGIACGTILGYILYGIGYSIIALYMTLDSSREIFKYIFWLIFPFLVLLITFVLLNNFLPVSGDTTEYVKGSLLKLSFLLFSLLISLLIVNRDGLLLNFAKTEINKFLKKPQ